MTIAAVQMSKAAGARSCFSNYGRRPSLSLQIRPGSVGTWGVLRTGASTQVSAWRSRSGPFFTRLVQPAVARRQRVPVVRCVADAPTKRTRAADKAASGGSKDAQSFTEPTLLPFSAVGIPSPLKFLWFSNDPKDKAPKAKAAASGLSRVHSIRSTTNLAKQIEPASAGAATSFDEVDPGYWSDDEGFCWMDGGEGLYGCSSSSMSPFETPQITTCTSTTPEELYDASEQLKKAETLPLPPPPQKNSWIPTHLMGLHTMWRGMRGSLRQGAVGKEAPEADSKEVKAEQPQKKANMWAMAALLNWQREEADKKEEAARKAKGCGECEDGVGGADACCLSGQPPRGALAEVPRVQVAHTRESFSPFLQRASVQELRTVALLSKMCDLAYYIPMLSDGDLFRQYRLRLHTTSLELKAHATRQQLKEMEAAKETASEQNRQATARLTDAVLSYVASTPSTAYALAAAAANSAVSYIPSSFQPFGAKPSEAENPPTPNEVPVLENSSEMNASEIIHTIHRESPQAEVSAVSGSEAPSTADDPELPHTNSAESAGVGSESSLTLAVVESALTSAADESTPASAESAEDGTIAPTEPQPMCPCEWFIADDMSSRTRYFIIQGSDSLASWQTNLSFEPVPFEDPELGIMVHRGIYDAAKGLYAQLLPFVKQHMKENGGHMPRLRFAGHSLGGSLAVLMSLMLQMRGDVPRDAVLPVHTFGAPSMMCGGDHLLEELGLPANHVVNIVMHRDIVPRAFACDYPDNVVEVLRRMGGGFKEHACLKNLNLLFAPMGVMMVLQPDEDQAPFHPLLPEGGALLQIRHPKVNPQESKERRREKLTEVRSAQRALLNTPHPLEILSDPGAYGNEGSISRDHDPRNYTKALNAILRQESRRQRRRLREERRTEGWAPLVEKSPALVGIKSISGEGGVLELPAKVGVAGTSHVGSKRGVEERELASSGARAGGVARSRKVGKGGVRVMTTKERSKRYLNLLESKAMRLGAAQSS